MASDDDKFAWLKTDVVNARIDEWLRRGEPVEYDDLLEATAGDDGGDPGMTSFASGSGGDEKGRYVVFQYGLVIQDSRGRLAVFERVPDDKGHGRRNLEGRSILVSGSRMMKPHEALESIFGAKLSFGRRGSPGRIEPIGFALNRQPPENGRPRGHYLFALYRLTIDGNRLNGLVRENPDSFHGWYDLDTLPTLEGPVDDIVVRAALRPDEPQAVLGSDAETWYQPASRLVDRADRPLGLDPFHVPASRTVFLSHDAGAQLKAFLLRDVLIKRSRGRVYPFLDMHDVFTDERQFWERIERLIDMSDVLLVMVTEGTRESDGVRREIAHAMSSPNPPAIVVVRVDGTPDDCPEELRHLSHEDYTGRHYRTWHVELASLIRRIEKQPFRGP